MEKTFNLIELGSFFIGHFLSIITSEGEENLFDFNLFFNLLFFAVALQGEGK